MTAQIISNQILSLFFGFVFVICGTKALFRYNNRQLIKAKSGQRNQRKKIQMQKEAEKQRQQYEKEYAQMEKQQKKKNENKRTCERLEDELDSQHYILDLLREQLTATENATNKRKEMIDKRKLALERQILSTTKRIWTIENQIAKLKDEM